MLWGKSMSGLWNKSLAARFQSAVKQDEQYALEAANVTGSTSIAGIQDRGVQRDDIGKEQEKKREQQLQQWLDIIQQHIDALHQQAAAWEQLANQLQTERDQLLANLDQKYQKMETLQELVDEYQQTGNIDQNKLDRYLRHNKIILAGELDNEAVHLCLCEELRETRTEANQQQQEVENLNEKILEAQKHAREIRLEAEALKQQKCGCHSPEQAEALLLTAKQKTQLHFQQARGTQIDSKGDKNEVTKEYEHDFGNDLEQTQVIDNRNLMDLDF